MQVFVCSDYLSLYLVPCYICFFFFKQKTAYEMRISDWSSDVCSSDLHRRDDDQRGAGAGESAACAGWRPATHANAECADHERRSAGGMTMLKKDFGLSVKDVSDEGTFEGYASTFGGSPDSYGDVVLPGAFA